ncbi:MAG: MerC domain-containing protein [Bdellovibrio sp.]
MDEQILSPDMAQENAADASTCCDVDHSQHKQFEETTDRWDKVGIFLSGLCAIHCLITPILLLTMPVWGKVFEEEWVHLMMAVFVAPIGLFAFWSGYTHHKKTRVFALGILGISLVVGASLAPHSWVEFFGHDLITIFGSISLITAHVLNRRACLCHRH